MRGVLTIAILLRFMDSFMIYTEPFVLTGGGPGNATTFLSQFLTTIAVGRFDLGPAAAFSIIYRSEEHTSELQSLMRISYAVFCLKKKKQTNTTAKHKYTTRAT